jgi:hypothetical protein
MRTDQEIIDQINVCAKRDWLGFEAADLINCLSFEAAKPLLKEGVTEDQWVVVARDRESILKKMLDYMPFAWEKANNGRGLSAGRTMSHYMAWIFLAGDDLGDLTEYQYYGKDHLVKICNHYGWDSSQWDDGVRQN